TAHFSELVKDCSVVKFEQYMTFIKEEMDAFITPTLEILDNIKYASTEEDVEMVLHAKNFKNMGNILITLINYLTEHFTLMQTWVMQNAHLSEQHLAFVKKELSRVMLLTQNMEERIIEFESVSDWAVNLIDERAFASCNSNDLAYTF